MVDAQNGAVGDVWEFLEVGAHDAELKVPETLGGWGSWSRRWAFLVISIVCLLSTILDYTHYEI